MTEEEAKTKWCPMVRNMPIDPRSFAASPDPLACCIGSACMMWRGQHAPVGRPLEPWERAAEAEQASEMLKSGHGYCGLGGRP
jgi:hypothetical protein